ncbi:MAG: hypothetical protein ACRDWA_09050 [Acidimicrobiia bacterium]
MGTLKRRAARSVLWLARKNPALKRRLGRHRMRGREQVFDGGVQISSQRYMVVAGTSGFAPPKVGIYLRGACDLPALFAMAPLLRGRFAGTCAIYRDSIEISGSRSDLLLQSLSGVSGIYPNELTETIGQLRLKRHYFDPVLFQPTFEIPRRDQLETFPKSVVALSIAPDYSRVLYRHRQQGFLVDPGGWWLNQDLGKVLTDLEVAKWFGKTFEGIGRMSVEDFYRDMGRVISELRARAGANVIVFNTLAMDPASQRHNYQLMRDPEMHRRREFVVALFDLAAELSFPVIDVDRVLKTNGVSQQVDFAHFNQEQYAPLAEECHQVLRDLEVL